MSALATLIAARARIADPSAWTKLAYARNAMGEQVPARSPQARCWCAFGSLEAEHVSHFGDVGDFLRRAAKAVHGIPVVGVNDDVAFGHAGVLAMYDHAIAQAAAEAEAR